MLVTYSKYKELGATLLHEQGNSSSHRFWSHACTLGQAWRSRVRAEGLKHSAEFVTLMNDFVGVAFQVDFFTAQTDPARALPPGERDF